jgi:hypothetical protein
MGRTCKNRDIPAVVCVPSRTPPSCGWTVGSRAVRERAAAVCEPQSTTANEASAANGDHTTRFHRPTGAPSANRVSMANKYSCFQVPISSFEVLTCFLGLGYPVLMFEN